MRTYKTLREGSLMLDASGQTVTTPGLLVVQDGQTAVSPLGAGLEFDSEGRVRATSGAGGDNPLPGLAQWLDSAGSPAHLSYVIGIFGDSTLSDQTIAWTRKFATWLGTAAEGVCVKRVAWDAANSRFGAPVTVNAADGDLGLLCSADGYGLLEFESYREPAVGEGIIWDVELAPASWTPASEQAILSRYDFASFNGQAIGQLALRTTGALRFYGSPNGTTTGAFSVSSSVAVPFTGSQRGWVRVQVIPSEGNWNVTFHTSTDGVTWTALGTAFNQVGNAELPLATSAPYQIGRASGAPLVGGTIFNVVLRGQADGRMLNPYGMQGITAVGPLPATRATWVGSPTVYVVNAAISGSTSSAITAPMIVPFVVGTTLWGHSHNHTSQTPLVFLSSRSASPGSIGAFQTLRKARAYGPLTVVVQNPQIGAATYKLDHMARILSLRGWAADNGANVFDINAIFQARGLAAGDYADDVHPSDAGNTATAEALQQSVEAQRIA